MPKVLLLEILALPLVVRMGARHPCISDGSISHAAYARTVLGETWPGIGELWLERRVLQLTLAQCVALALAP